MQVADMTRVRAVTVRREHRARTMKYWFPNPSTSYAYTLPKTG